MTFYRCRFCRSAPEIGNGQGEAEPDFHRPAKQVNQQLHAGSIIFLLQDAIRFPEDVPGADLFVSHHDELSPFRKIWPATP